MEEENARLRARMSEQEREILDLKMIVEAKDKRFRELKSDMLRWLTEAREVLKK
jgi:hypothetical protein